MKKKNRYQNYLFCLNTKHSIDAEYHEQKLIASTEQSSEMEVQK